MLRTALKLQWFIVLGVRRVSAVDSDTKGSQLGPLI